MKPATSQSGKIIGNGRKIHLLLQPTCRAQGDEQVPTGCMLMSSPFSFASMAASLLRNQVPPTRQGLSTALGKGKAEHCRKPSDRAKHIHSRTVLVA